MVLAVETYLALRETAEVRADPEALRALAEARQAVQEGDVIYGADAVRESAEGAPGFMTARYELGTAPPARRALAERLSVRGRHRSR